MPFDKAVQSLAFLEEKLRRAFNLAGVIGARLQPGNVTPVVLVQDVTQPGYANDQGRCWAWSLNAGSPAGVSVVVLLFGRDVLIEALYTTGEIAAGNDIQAYVTTPTETIPAAAATPQGAWRDRKTIAADVPPILTSGAAFVALTGTAASAANVVQLWKGGAATLPGTLRTMPIMIPAGGTLTWRSNAASVNVALGCWGRIWP